MSTETDAFVNELASESPLVRSLLDEHIRYYDEILSTVLMAEIVRKMVARLDQPAETNRVLAALDRHFAEGNPVVQTVIATGFLEALPHADEEGYELVARLGPVLAEEMRRRS